MIVILIPFYIHTILKLKVYNFNKLSLSIFVFLIASSYWGVNNLITTGNPLYPWPLLGLPSFIPSDFKDVLTLKHVFTEDISVGLSLLKGLFGIQKSMQIYSIMMYSTFFL